MDLDLGRAEENPSGFDCDRWLRALGRPARLYPAIKDCEQSAAVVHVRGARASRTDIARLRCVLKGLILAPCLQRK